jgi:hypothetical protein
MQFVYVPLTDIHQNQVHEYWLQLTVSSHSFCLSGSRRFFKPSTSLRSEPMYAFFCDNTILSSSRHGVNCSTSSLVSYNKLTLHIMYCTQCRLNYITYVSVSSTMLSVVLNGRMMCRTKQLWSNFRYYPSICMEILMRITNSWVRIASIQVSTWNKQLMNMKQHR